MGSIRRGRPDRFVNAGLVRLWAGEKSLPVWKRVDFAVAIFGSAVCWGLLIYAIVGFFL